jgi:hypothetical protein
MNAQIGTVIFSVAGLIGLWFLVFCLWDDHRQVIFRQELFDLRRELFAFAQTGAISFDDPYYKGLRRQINSMIRYAYHVNFATLVLTMVTRLVAPETLRKSNFRERIASDPNLHAEVRKQLLRVHDRMSIATAKQVVVTSLFGGPALAITLMLRVLYLFISGSLFHNLDDFRKDVFLQKPVVQHMQYMEAQALQSEKQERLCGVGASA